jgi:hypothetical protein
MATESHRDALRAEHTVMYKQLMNDNDLDPKNAEIARLREALTELILQIERGDPIDSDGHPLVNLQAFHAAKAAAGEEALQAARSKPVPEIEMYPLE